MTLSDLENMTVVKLTPAQVGEVLGINPNTIRWQAHDNPAALGFPVIVVKSRTYIPREAFIRWMAGTASDKTA